jgi:hypothetical protein
MANLVEIRIGLWLIMKDVRENGIGPGERGDLMLNKGEIKE